MNNYFLFIDTEATGLPKNWQLPYDSPNNWPHAVQVSWLVYTRAGEKLEEQNHYIFNDAVEISAGAARVHGLTKEFLQQHGKARRRVLEILTTHLLRYQPLVIGHFLELDYRVVGAEYFREGMDNPMEALPTFCIMLASKHLQHNPHAKFLKLGELYETLFKKALLFQHNAMTDATATADCFFELLKRQELRSLVQAPIVFADNSRVLPAAGWAIVVIVLLFILVSIAYYYG